MAPAKRKAASSRRAKKEERSYVIKVKETSFRTNTKGKGQGNGQLADTLFLSGQLGVTICVLRSAKHISQTELADNLGLSQPALSLIEAGKRAITVDLLAKVAGFFGLTPGILLDLCEVRDTPGKVLSEAAEVFDAISR